MFRMSRGGRGPAPVAAIVISLLVAAACASTPTPQPSAGAATATPAATGTPALSDIDYAMRQRQLFGLRADRAWVEAVAADPRATVGTLDFPMLPEEEAAFTSRQADFDTVAGAVKRYAETVQDEFGGVYIDQARHVVVALWTARPAEHRIRILERLGAFAPLEVRQVRHSEHDLDALAERIAADWNWMRSAGAAPLGVGTEIMDNVVSLQVSSANPAIGAQVLLHYGVGPDMLRVDSDGSGVFLLPRGTIKGTVVTAEGRAPGNRGELMLNWEGDGPGECGIGDMGYGVGANGAFEVPCSPGGWTILVMAPRVPEGWVEVGRGHVVVPAGGKVTLRITLQPGARASP